MKIVHISLYPPKGEKHISTSGVASYTKNLVTAIPYKSSNEVYVLCDMIGGMYEKYQEDGITVVRCFSKSPRFFKQINAELKKISPNVTHIQQEISLYGNISTAYLLQWLVFVSRKFYPIITLHGVVSLKKVNKAFVKENNSSLPSLLVKAAFIIIYKPLTIWAKKIIVHEDYFKNILAHEYNVSRKKIKVIPHGVESLQADKKQTACKKLGLNPESNLVLFMGFLTGYKGIELLIEGFGKYARENPNAYLVVGAGVHPKLKNDQKYLQEYKRLQKKAKKLIPQHQHRWTGFIDEQHIRDHYSACDVSVYPYTIAMSSSGPMSFAIGFEKPFLASTAFKDVFDKKLLFEHTPSKLAEKFSYFFTHEKEFLLHSRTLKQSRVWKAVGARTYNIYKENLQ